MTFADEHGMENVIVELHNWLDGRYYILQVQLCVLFEGTEELECCIEALAVLMEHSGGSRNPYMDSRI